MQLVYETEITDKTLTDPFARWWKQTGLESEGVT